ncbi:MAG: PQQ-dependent sugar dehydrogenase [Gaiellaceae bacterium]
MRLWPGVVALSVLVVAFAGCAGDEDESVLPAEPLPATTEPAPPTTSTEEEEKPSRPLRLRRFASGFEAPVHVTAAPGEPGRLYVVEQEGRIRVLEGRRILPESFLDVAGEVVSGGEQGLLSVAFHPGYEENRFFYVNYTDTEGDTVVAEYRARESGQPERTRELLFVDQPYANHNGGQLAFGPDGLLYVGMGDGGSGGDPENRAQDLGDQLGKLLRADVSRDEPEWEIVAYGLRNPWRFSFDRETGDLWIGDVGQGDWEEIDVLRAGEQGLVNFGWDVLEGSHPHEDKEPNPEGALVGPAFEYPHELGCSVTGGFVYRGEKVERARSRYFFGDYCSGIVWSLSASDSRAKAKRLRFEVPSLSSFGEDLAGELYLVSLEGAIYRLAD